MLTCRIWSGGVLIFSGPAHGVLIPSSQGQLGILTGHASVTTTIHPGFVEVVYEQQSVQIEVSSGVCLIENNEVHLWTSHASITNTIDEVMANWVPLSH